MADAKNIGLCIGTGLVAKGRFIRRISVNAKSIDIDVSIDVAKELARSGYNVFLLGGKAEEIGISQYDINALPGVFSFVGKTSIIDSIALMSICELVIGGDTGLIHIADAIGVKTLVYYGATGPIVGPFSEKTTAITANLNCQYCYGKDDLFKCKDRKCLKYISARRIISNVHKIISI